MTLARLACIGLLLGTVPAAAETLTVKVTGASGPQGKIVISLWNGPKGFSGNGGKPLVNRSAPVAGGGATFSFEGLPPGRYAVSAFHDTDADGKLKTNFIGMPREPVGVSGKAGGMPSFEKSVFVVPSPPITIALRSLGG